MVAGAVLVRHRIVFLVLVQQAVTALTPSLTPFASYRIVRPEAEALTDVLTTAVVALQSRVFSRRKQLIYAAYRIGLTHHLGLKYLRLPNHLRLTHLGLTHHLRELLHLDHLAIGLHLLHHLDAVSLSRHRYGLSYSDFVVVD